VDPREPLVLEATLQELRVSLDLLGQPEFPGWDKTGRLGGRDSQDSRDTRDPQDPRGQLDSRDPPDPPGRQDFPDFEGLTVTLA